MGQTVEEFEEAELTAILVHVPYDQWATWEDIAKARGGDVTECAGASMLRRLEVLVWRAKLVYRWNASTGIHEFKRVYKP